MIPTVTYLLNQGMASTKAHPYYSILGSTVYLGGLLLELHASKRDQLNETAQDSSNFWSQLKRLGIIAGARITQFFAFRLLTPMYSERRLFKVIETILFCTPFFVSYRCSLSDKPRVHKLGKHATNGLSVVAKLACSVSIGLFAANDCSYQKRAAVATSCLALSIFTLYKTRGMGFIEPTSEK